MPDLRDEIFAWTSTARLNPADAPRALEIAGLTPSRFDWRNFLNALLLWTGVILIASGVIFFFAYNWHDLHRFAKFALAESVFAAALIAAWIYGTERPAGKAALLGASILTGAILALIGQTYQTGADTFELFAYWAALILPWVVVARFAPLWLFWIALVNIAIGMCLNTRSWGLLGFLFNPTGIIWTLFWFNLAALAAWELGLLAGVAWLERWGARVVSVVAGGFATTIGVLSIVETREFGPGAAVAYLAWFAAMFLYYRLRSFDVFMLAGLVLSAIVTLATFLGKTLLSHGDPFGFLLLSIAVIGMSGAGAWWIRQMVREKQA